MSLTLPFFRKLLLIPGIVYLILTPFGVIRDLDMGVLGFHPDGLLIFEVVGITFCTGMYFVLRPRK